MTGFERRIFFGGLLAGLCQVAHAAAITPEMWDRPRTAATVMEQPAVRQVVNAYLARGRTMLVIRHAPVTDSVLQAEELRSWLIALAVEAGRLRLRGDLAPGHPLTLEIEP